MAMNSGSRCEFSLINDDDLIYDLMMGDYIAKQRSHGVVSH